MNDPDKILNSLRQIGFTEDEIQQKVKRKKRELGGFMSNEGILFLVAKEEGINVDSPQFDRQLGDHGDYIDYDEFLVSTDEVREGMNNIVVYGRIHRTFQLHEFMRKDGTPGIVGSFLLKDKSGEIKVVVWGKKTEILSNEFFSIGQPVRVVADYAKMGRYDETEIHVGRKGDIQIDPEDADSSSLPEVEDPSQEIKIEDINLSMRRTGVKGVVDAIFKSHWFDRKDGTKGQVRNCYIKDETGKIQVTFWNQDATLLDELEAGDRISFSGLSVREDTYHDAVSLTFTDQSRLERISSEAEQGSGISQAVSDKINIKDLREQDGFVNESVEGTILEDPAFKTIERKRDGKKLYLLTFILMDDLSAIAVNVWGELAQKLREILVRGMNLRVTNLLIKRNDYTSDIEATFTKSTKLDFLS